MKMPLRYDWLRLLLNGCATRIGCVRRKTFDETSSATATVLRNRRLGGGGFTLIEIVVAIGILVMVMGFAGVIFQRSIGSYRAAMAQDEIMTKLRVITEQLDSDFRGLRKDAPMYIWFEFDPNSNNNRYDQIMFFADGDFQSTQTYNGQPVVGNVARIYYGQANNPDALPAKNRLLARRQHILTADESILVVDRWPDYDPVNFALTFGNPVPGTTILKNDANEYDWVSLSQWQTILNDPLNNPANVLKTVDICFTRPKIDFSDPNTIHNFMTDGIGSFSIQWDYITSLGEHFWWPALDPDGNPSTSDSDFDAMVSEYGLPSQQFGIYFYSAPPGGIWSLPDGAQYTHPPTSKPVYPKALKFVFVIYDSRGVFPDGQTFSHIVYIGD
jgi:type II secretory pathway pseudopilin PulG